MKRVLTGCIFILGFLLIPTLSVHAQTYESKATIIFKESKELTLIPDGVEEVVETPPLFEEGHQLPKTTTNMYTYFLLGIMLFLIGIMSYMLQCIYMRRPQSH